MGGTALYALGRKEERKREDVGRKGERKREDVGRKWERKREDVGRKMREKKDGVFEMKMTLMIWYIPHQPTSKILIWKFLKL